MCKRTIYLGAVALIALGAGYLCFKTWAGDFAFLAGNRKYYQQHDYQAALEEYIQVKPASLHYAAAQRYIGHNIYGREWGQWEKGIPYLEEALSVAPEDPKVLEDAGRAYVNVGRLKVGAELLRRANTEVAQTALAQFDESAGQNH